MVNSDLIANRGKCHLLLLPLKESYPEYLKGILQNSSLPERII
ncbi:MAG TPA: hypothetical protein PKD83_08430 [Ignavibacteria bacterium]|nr:hypothetical protein [Ignavibacteria bacterium]